MADAAAVVATTTLTTVVAAAGEAQEEQAQEEPRAEAVEAANAQQDVREYLGKMVLPTVGPAIEQLLHYVHESGELQKALKEKEAESRPAKEKDRKSRHHADREGHATRDKEGSRERREHKGEHKGEHKDHKHGGAEAGKPRRKDVEEAVQRSESKPVSEGHATREKGSREHKGEHKDHKGEHKGEHKDHKHGGAEGGKLRRRGSKDLHESVQRSESKPLVEVKPFDPLVWLADHLRQSATTPEEAYRDVIQKRIAELKQRRKEEEDEAAALAAAQAAEQEASAAKDENGAESTPVDQKQDNTRSAPPSRG